MTESNRPVLLSLAPATDPDHPFAQKYQLAVDLIQDYGETRVADLLWEMLDDTPFMIRVFAWISQLATQAELVERSRKWYTSGYRDLVSACLGTSLELRMTVCRNCVIEDDLDYLRVCLGDLGTEPIEELFHLAVKDYRRSRSVVTWFISNYPSLAAIARTDAHKIGNRELWDLVREQSPMIRLSNAMVLEMDPSLVECSYQSGQITSQQVLMLVTKMTSPKPGITSWGSRGSAEIAPFLEQDYPAIREILKPHQLDLCFLVYQNCRIADDMASAKMLIQLLDDVHAGQEWIAHMIIPMRHNERSYYSTEYYQSRIWTKIDHAKELLTWLCDTYPIDLFARGLPPTSRPPDLFQFFHEHSVRYSAVNPTRFYYNGSINCLISATVDPLPIPATKVYRINQGYLYTDTMVFDPEREQFYDCEGKVALNLCSVGDSDQVKRATFLITDLQSPQVHHLGRLPDFLRLAFQE